MKKYYFSLFIFLITSYSKVFASNYYWQGGSGNWSEISHWWDAPTGGNQMLVVPGAIDDVFFTANSFSGSGQSVNIDNSFPCRDLNWTGALYNPQFIAGGNYIFQVYGNLTFITAMTVNIYCPVQFLAISGSKKITMAGHDFSKNDILFEPKAGVAYTLQDDFLAYSINLKSGELNTSNQTVSIKTSLGCESSSILTLGNSQINITSAASLFGTINQGTSTLNILGGGNYPVSYFQMSTSIHLHHLNVLYSGKVNIDANGGKIDKLTTNASLELSSSCTFDSIEFNKPGYASINKMATITINKSFVTNKDACSKDNPIYFYTNPDDLAYGAKATINVPIAITLNNAGFQNTQKTGPGSITANNSSDLGGNTGITINAPALAGNYYWIGGNGNWDDPKHWSLSNGGNINACGAIPSLNDNVYFTSASGSGTVTINGGSVCKNMDWTGSSLTLEKYSGIFTSLYINGSLTLNPSMTNNYSDAIYFISPSMGNTIDSKGISIISTYVYICSMGGNYNLLNNLNTTSIFIHASGGLNSNNLNLNCWKYISQSDNIRNFTLGSSHFSLNGFGTEIILNTTNYFLNAGTSLIDFTSEYSSLFLTGNETRVTFYDIKFSNPLSTSYIYQNTNIISHSYHNIEFHGHGSFFGSDYNINNILLASNKNYIFNSKTNFNLTGEIITPEGCGGLINMFSSKVDVAANIRKLSGKIQVNNCFMKDINGTGGASFNANNSTDNGNNPGWIFTPPETGNFYWIGGSGNWSDCKHWSHTSGGPANCPCIPSANDNVYFDAKSFNTTGQSVFIDLFASCKTMDWSASGSNNPILDGNDAYDLSVYGSLILNNTLTWTFQGSLFFSSTDSGNVINTFVRNISSSITFNGTGAWKQTSDLKGSGSISFNSGVWDLNDKNISLMGQTPNFTSLTSSARTLKLTSSIITIYGGYGFVAFYSDGLTLEAGTSTFKLQGGISTFYVVGYSSNLLHFHNIIFEKNYNFNISFMIENSQNNCSFNKVEFSSSSINSKKSIYCNNIYDTLILTASLQPYYFEALKTQTVKSKLIAMGSPCGRILMYSTSTLPDEKAIFETNPGNELNISYGELRNITANLNSGSSTYNASNYSIDAGGCSNWNFNTKHVNKIFLQDTINLGCAKSPYLIDGNKSRSGIGWKWNNGSMDTISTYSANNLGWNKVKVNLSSDLFCEYTDSVYLIKTVMTSRIASVACGSASTSVNGGTGIYAYSWNTIPEQTSAKASGLNAGTYTVTITDNSGCMNTQTVTITKLTASINISSPNNNYGNGTQLIANGGNGYHWLPIAGLSCNYCSNPFANPTQTTDYCVEAFDGYGCSDTACIKIEGKTNCWDFFIPNAFSPNNDGRNDVLCVQSECLKEINFSIYDRLGEKVFQTTELNTCWDGAFNGKIMNPAIFVYYFHGILLNGDPITQKGHLSLVR